MRASSRIGITMGDSAGIGPEVVCKALAAMPDDERAATLVIGDRLFMERAARLVHAGDIFTGASGVRLVEVEAPNRDAILPGVLSSDAGEAAYRCVKRAVEMAQAGEIDVIVTASLNKAALRAAGYPHNGHAGLLAHFTGAKRSYAVLVCPQLTVIHVSTHIALARAPGECRIERILDTIRAGHAHMLSTGVAHPRIALAASTQQSCAPMG